MKPRLIKKLFQFWEHHLLVQIAYLIKKGFQKHVMQATIHGHKERNFIGSKGVWGFQRLRITSILPLFLWSYFIDYVLFKEGTCSGVCTSVLQHHDLSPFTFFFFFFLCFFFNHWTFFLNMPFSINSIIVSIFPNEISLIAPNMPFSIN